MPHKPDCRCPICRARRRATASVQMSLRIDPLIKERILAHPKGARAYIEELVRQDHGQGDVRLQLLQAQNEIFIQTLRGLAGPEAGTVSRVARKALTDAGLA